MLERLDGETRLYAILGDPIAQVKSPGGITEAMVNRSANALLVPMHVTPDSFDTVMAGLRDIRNLDGLIMTVPHKIPVAGHLETMTQRARFLGACNILRRIAPGGGWHGDASDGYGCVSALRANGFDPQGKRVLLVGTGGAGSAIALELIEAGVAELALHDTDARRRDQLIERLNAHCAATGTPGRARTGSTDPTGFDLAANATPLGMRVNDPLPIDVTRLAPTTFASDVITAPVESPYLIAAAARGCRTQTGVDMFKAQVEFIADFLLAAAR